MSTRLDAAHREFQAHERMATLLQRKEHQRIVALVLALSGAGLVIGWLESDFMWFARTGAAVSALALLFLAQEFRRRRALDLIALAEADDVRMQARADLDPLFAAMHRRSTANHLAATAYGTLVWGFGDLLNLFL